MDNINGNDPNAGATEAGNLDTSDQGGQGVTPTSSSGTPGGQDGQNPGQWESEKANLIAQNRALNRALVEARRTGRSNTRNQEGSDYDAFSDPAGQYGMALQVATGQIREKMENVFSEYPEVPNEVLARIRKNPWAYTTQEAYMNADVDAGLEDIALYLLEEVERQNPNPADANANQNNQPVSPARVNANPAPEPTGEGAVQPEEDLWNMPLSELSKKKDKALAQAQKA